MFLTNPPTKGDHIICCVFDRHIKIHFPKRKKAICVKYVFHLENLTLYFVKKIPYCYLQWTWMLEFLALRETVSANTLAESWYRVKSPLWGRTCYQRQIFMLFRGIAGAKLSISTRSKSKGGREGQFFPWNFVQIHSKYFSKNIISLTFRLLWVCVHVYAWICPYCLNVTASMVEWLKVAKI